MKSIGSIALLLAFGLVAFSPGNAAGQAAPAVDPTDPHAKPAPQSDPESLFQTFFPMEGTLDELNKKYPLPQDPKIVRAFRQARFERRRESTVVAFSPDGKTMAMGNWDRTVKVWQIGPAK